MTFRPVVCLALGLLVLGACTADDSTARPGDLAASDASTGPGVDA